MLSFFTQIALAAVADPCKAILEDTDFEIEKSYPHVVVKTDSLGFPILPRGSKAFILWRQRSSPWIPDNLFAMHYLETGEKENFARAMIRNEVEEASTNPLGENLHHSLNFPATRFLHSDFKSLMHATRIHFSKSPERDGPFPMGVRWLEVETSSGIEYVWWDANTENSGHMGIEREILLLNPSVTMAGGGYIQFQMTTLTEKSKYLILSLNMRPTLKSWDNDDRSGIPKYRILRVLDHLFENGMPVEAKLQSYKPEQWERIRRLTNEAPTLEKLMKKLRSLPGDVWSWHY